MASSNIRNCSNLAKVPSWSTPLPSEPRDCVAIIGPCEEPSVCESSDKEYFPGTPSVTDSRCVSPTGFYECTEDATLFPTNNFLVMSN